MTLSLDPLARLGALAHAYRDSALAERSYYGVMFQQAIPGFRPSAGSLAVARASLEVLVQAVRAATDAGALRPGDPRAVAEVLWAGVHGVVSLGLAGHLPDPEAGADRFRSLARPRSSPSSPITRPSPGLKEALTCPTHPGSSLASCSCSCPRSSSAAGRCCA